MRTLETIAIALALSGCAVSKCPDSPVDARAPVRENAASKAADNAATPAKVVIDLAPNPKDRVLDVAIAFADLAGATELSIEAPAKGSVRDVHATDGGGNVDVAIDEANGALKLRLARAPRGALELKYRVAGIGLTRGSGVAPEVDADALRVRGRAVLALPLSLEHTAVDVELKIHPYGDARAGSSFGLDGDRTFRATGALLRDAIYLAAQALGEARFDSPEGKDEAGWAGYTAFDPRPISADVAAFRTAAREALRVPGGELATFFVIVDDGRTSFAASRAGAAVLLRLGLRDPWTGAMRIAVASEILKRWIGGEVVIMPDSKRIAEGFWFSEGASRALARTMLLRFGQITPAESIAEIDRLEAVARTSRLAKLGNVALAERSQDRGAIALMIARGALYATRVDGLLRAKTAGKHSLEDVARALVAKGRDARAPLPERAWLDALRDDLGDGETNAFAAAIGRGEVPTLPQEALGKCAVRGTKRYAAYELGFDLEATRDASNKMSGLAADGPAAKAGLTSDDTLVEIRLAGDDPEKAITIVVEHAGARREVKYAPLGLIAKGEAWTRVRDVPDEACAK